MCDNADTRESVTTVEDVENAAYHTTAYEAAGALQMSFKPINQIHQQLCGLHIYADDPGRSVKAHHFCTHLRKDLHQCIIYDSDKPDARLIGIEYVIPEEAFRNLPEEEKKYWHSHKFEVQSGMLMLGTKALVPSELREASELITKLSRQLVVDAVTDIAERPAMLELHRSYGKTIHTWQHDKHSDFPLGPPQLMMAYTAEEQVDNALLRERDEEMGVSTEKKREIRAGYLRPEDMDRAPLEGCDSWIKGQRFGLDLVDRAK